MADSISTNVSEVEQRNAAAHQFINEIDYHILCMRSELRATSCLIREINEDMTDKDSGSDLEAVVVMFWNLNDRMNLMLETQARRCEAE